MKPSISEMLVKADLEELRQNELDIREAGWEL